MPVDFDEDDISGVIEEAGAVPSRTPPTRKAPSEPEEEDPLSEIERRLEIAKYYRLVLDDTIFSDPPNVEIADRVEGEIREFVRGRMAALVGVSMQPPNQELPFSEEEVLALRTIAQPEVVSALKALAAKVLKKPQILDAKPLQPKKEAAPREPRLKKIVRPTPSRSTAVTTDKPESEKSEALASTKSKKQQKITKTVVTEEGKEIIMDITPQARPLGVSPLPPPKGKAAIEAASATAARQQSQSALNALERKLLGE
jgi:hypothetical protein